MSSEMFLVKRGAQSRSAVTECKQSEGVIEGTNQVYKDLQCDTEERGRRQRCSLAQFLHNNATMMEGQVPNLLRCETSRVSDCDTAQSPEVCSLAV